MKPKTTILMILAIGCGLAAAFFTNKLIAERNKPVEEVEKVTVLVAKKKIPAMAYISKADEFFEPQEKSKNDVPKNVLTDMEDKDLRDGFRVSRSFSAGNFLTRDDLISKEMEGLAGKVPRGMRAFAIRVTAETLAGGFVLPGSKVDVVWTFRTNNNESGSLTILQDMLVLAVDTQAARNPDNPQTILGATVTLAVKPEEAQKMALAKNNGELSLALRNVSDDIKLQLAGSKPGDLARTSSLFNDTKPEDTGDSTASAPATPPVPPLPALPTPMKDPTPPATTTTPTTTTTPVTDERPVKPVKFHRMVILDGGNYREQKFVFDDETQSYDPGAVKRSEVDPRAEPKPEAKPEPKLDAKPAESDKKSGDVGKTH
jgi:pilus assembly protein CpaB